MKALHCLIAALLLLWPGGAVLAQKGKKPLTETKLHALQDAYFEGVRQGALGNEQLAEQQFRTCLGIDPDHHASMYMLAKLSRHRKDLRQAEYWLQKALQLDHTNPWYFELMAEVQKLKHEFGKAGDTYLRLYKLQPANNEYLLDAGAMYSIGGEHYQSLKVYNLLEKRNGIHEDYSIAKENIYLQIRKPAKALKEIQRLSAAYPENLRYKGMVADLFMNLGMEKDGLKLYTEILGKDPGNGYAHFALSDYYFNRKEEIAATEELKKAISDRNIDLRLKMAALQERYPNTLGNKSVLFDLAQMGKILTAVHPGEADAYRFYADILVQQDKYDMARQVFEESLSHDNSAFEVYGSLCDLDQRLGDMKQLKAHADRGVELFPNMAVFYFLSMTASYRLGEYEAAANMALTGLETAPVDPELNLKLLAGLGDASHFTGNRQRSDSAYRQALQFDSNDTYVLNNFAYFLSVDGRHLDLAKQMSHKTLVLEPENATYKDTYGWILYKMGNYAEALTYVQEAVNSGEPNAEVLEHLGDIQWKNGSLNEARESWQRAKEAGGKGVLLKKIEQGKWLE